VIWCAAQGDSDWRLLLRRSCADHHCQADGKALSCLRQFALQLRLLNSTNMPSIEELMVR
jgi:hypothetical protein